MLEKTAFGLFFIWVGALLAGFEFRGAIHIAFLLAVAFFLIDRRVKASREARLVISRGSLLSITSRQSQSER